MVVSCEWVAIKISWCALSRRPVELGGAGMGDVYSGLESSYVIFFIQTKKSRNCKKIVLASLVESLWYRKALFRVSVEYALVCNYMVVESPSPYP